MLVVSKIDRIQPSHRVQSADDTWRLIPFRVARNHTPEPMK